MSVVTVVLRLRHIEDLFRTPDIDPFSEWYQPYSAAPAIQYVEACLGDKLLADRLHLVIRLPRGALRPETGDDVCAALDRYCDARLSTVHEESKRNNARGWLMFVLALIVVNLFLFVAHRLEDAGLETLSVVAEGLSIAAWLLLWHPLEALVFNRWDFRLDRRVLRIMRHSAVVRIEEVDIPA